MNEEKKIVLNNIDYLIEDLLKTGKAGQITFFKKLKNEIQSADKQKLQALMMQISTMAPMGQYAGFTLGEENRLYALIDSAIDYLHHIKK